MNDDMLNRCIKRLEDEEAREATTLLGLAVYLARNTEVLDKKWPQGRTQCMPHVIVNHLIYSDRDAFICGKCWNIITGMQDMQTRLNVRRRRKRGRRTRY